MLRNWAINNAVLWLIFTNWHYNYQKPSPTEAVTAVPRYQPVWPASDVLLESSLAGDMKRYSTHFAGKKKKKKKSQRHYHPSFPAYGVLSPSVDGSRRRFKAG